MIDPAVDAPRTNDVVETMTSVKGTRYAEEAKLLAGMMMATCAILDAIHSGDQDRAHDLAHAIATILDALVTASVVSIDDIASIGVAASADGCDLKAAGRWPTK